MYRYFQSGETDEWRPRQDPTPHDPWAFAYQHGATRVSILAVSRDIDIVGEKVKYQGPLYFDIDSKDINEALQSGKELCSKLLSLGVQRDDIEVHLSGSKGLHIFVDQRVFSSGRPVLNLPLIYKRMAVDLYVPGIDSGVYSVQKGTVFRPPNSKRPDGRYKVRVGLEELSKLSSEGYFEKVKQPHSGSFPTKPAAPAAGLQDLFSTCSSGEIKVPKLYAPVDDAALSQLKGARPPCIEELARGKERSGVPFNLIALNVACWAARGGQTNVLIDSLFTRIAEKTTSTKYSTETDRKRHLQGILAYVSGAKDQYPFSCAGMLSTITTSPCSECALKKDAPSMSMASMNDLFVYCNGSRYFSDRDLDRPITSFSLKILSAILDEGTNKIKSMQLEATSAVTGETYILPNVSEESWTSKNLFKQVLQGFPGLAFLGTDNDLTKLRLTLTRNEIMGAEEMRQIFRVPSIGVHSKRLKGPDNIRHPDNATTFVYVEPGFSISSLGLLDTHVLSGDNHIAPTLKYRELTEGVSESANLALETLTRINHPHITAALLGWYFACHLKTHIYDLEGKFPVLCVSGISGAGKNSAIAAFQRLAGLTGEAAAATIEAPNSTRLPFQMQLTNSRTIPRVINELNKKSVSDSHYKMIIEMVKAAFDSQIVAKGRIGGDDPHGDGVNVGVSTWRCTAPVVTLSEEMIPVPAVLQRGVPIRMEPMGLDRGKSAFYLLQPMVDDLTEVASALVDSALHTTYKEVDAMLRDSGLPDEVKASTVPERVKFGYSVVLVGLTWGKQKLLERGLSRTTLESIERVEKHLLKHLVEEVEAITKEATVTEVDKILNDLCVMAHNGKNVSDNLLATIKRGVHYAKVGDSLWIDMQIVYPMLARFKMSVGERLPIQDFVSFNSAVKGVNYCISTRSVCKHLPGTGVRPILQLSVPLLDKANIPTDMF